MMYLSSFEISLKKYLQCVLCYMQSTKCRVYRNKINIFLALNIFLFSGEDKQCE